MVNLKDYIDFAITLREMEEVKENKFHLPKEITFSLNNLEHITVQTQAHEAKGLELSSFESKDEFVVTILDIDFKFVKNEP